MATDTNNDNTPKPGDLVKLRSGGPLMTFVRLTDTQPAEAYCVWFAGDMAQAGTFPLHALESTSRH